MVHSSPNVGIIPRTSPEGHPLHFALIAVAALAGDPAEKVGKFTHGAIAEPSGLVASRRFPGIFWVHNDSGNLPSLFAVKADGTLVREYRVQAANLDWEDIAIDDAGHLYVGDIGNNLRVLPVRVVHRIDEPDPSVAPTGRLKVAESIYFVYPEGKMLDAEALVVDGERLVVVAKGLDGRDAEMFAVPLRATSLRKPAKAEAIGALKGFDRPATGADLSADGRRLAVCALGEVRVYRRDADGRWLPEAKLKGPKGQVEAIAWDGADLMLANEERELFRIREADWKPRPTRSR